MKCNQGHRHLRLLQYEFNPKAHLKNITILETDHDVTNALQSTEAFFSLQPLSLSPWLHFIAPELPVKYEAKSLELALWFSVFFISFHLFNPSTKEHLSNSH